MPAPPVTVVTVDTAETRLSRDLRRQPVQPFSAHGFLGNIPANGVLPRPRPLTVVDRVDQRARFLPLPAIVLRGVLVSSGVGVPGTVPPRPVNVDRVDQRHRYRPLDPAVFDGLLASSGPAPTVTPPGPFVVPLEERRRFLSALPPTTLRGVDDVLPPRPASVEPDDRQRRLRPPVAPQALSGAYILLLAPFVAPPAPLSLDRVDQRGRYRSVDPTVLSGILASVTHPAGQITLTLTPHPFGGLVLLVHPFN